MAIFSMIFALIVSTIIERTLLQNMKSYYANKGLNEEETIKKIFAMNIYLLITMIIACSFLLAANLSVISVITMLAVLESFFELILLTFVYK